MATKTGQKRFTVSLDAEDYDALKTFGDHQKPPLKLQYLIQLSVRRLLDETKSGHNVIHLSGANQ